MGILATLCFIGVMPKEIERLQNYPSENQEWLLVIQDKLEIDRSWFHVFGKDLIEAEQNHAALRVVRLASSVDGNGVPIFNYIAYCLPAYTPILSDMIHRHLKSFKLDEDGEV